MPNPSLITVDSFTHHIFECLDFIFLSKISVFADVNSLVTRPCIHYPKGNRLHGVCITFSGSLPAERNTEPICKGIACLIN